MKRYFKQTFTVVVLSEDVPLEWDNLADIARVENQIVSDDEQEISEQEYTKQCSDRDT